MNSNFTTLEATYRIATPMFCNGADQQKAELRLPSFKGALRFWWRSLMWGDRDGKTYNVAELHKKEARLFGASDQKVGQSKVRLRLTSNSVADPESSADWASGKGVQYIGYGVMDYRGQLTRPMIPGGTFRVELRIGPRLSEQEIGKVQKALILLGSIGGLGSKSRKGFGSLTLTALQENGQSIELSAEPAERIRSAIEPRDDRQPDWTAWSKQSRIVTVTGSRRAVDLLDKLGREQVHFRSWGNNGRVIDRDSERNFREDHDLSKGQAVAIQHPKRIVFGLPHNYGQGDSKAVAPASRELDRRASPLFLHVHQPSDGVLPIGVVAFLPALFLPEGEQIRAFGNNVPLDTSDVCWEPIHGYLDRLIGKPGATKKQTDINGEDYKMV